MKDETFVFISDVKDKKVTARSARHKRTHNGKGGRVRFPSDNLSKKELEKMNGECKSYRLNDPMTLDEFMSMPDDIKCTYIKLIRKKFNAPVTQIAKMMGVSEATVRKELKRLGLNEGKTRSGKTKWDMEGFYAWWHGVDKLPEPVVQEIAITQEEEYVEDDLPFEEPEAVVEEDIPCEVPESILPNYAELVAELEKAKAEIVWLRHECESQSMNARILEAQMEVVRLIFGGGNRA